MGELEGYAKCTGNHSEAFASCLQRAAESKDKDAAKACMTDVPDKSCFKAMHIKKSCQSKKACRTFGLAAIGVGGIVLLCLLFCCYRCCCRKKKVADSRAPSETAKSDYMRLPEDAQTPHF